MKLSEELKERGLIYQSSPENPEKILDEGVRTVYLGIDPTAEAIHVGNLVPYMVLNHFLKAGHKVIILQGGGTARIGDPSGRDTEREFVDELVVDQRAERMKQNVTVLTKTGDITFVNNYDWLSKLDMIEFLRDVGKYFTVNTMMKRESVAARLESENGISFTEFSYALLQSYDFYHLHKEHGCDLQIGGSDQWGNIVSGIDYVRRKTGEEVYGLTLPLIIDSASGKKFGKSMGNAVWLDAEKTSPYDFYQFWFNTSDEDAIRYLKIFTLLPLEEIAAIEKEFNEDRSTRLAQQRLAEEVTRFVHGESVVIETPVFKAGNAADIVGVLVESGLTTSKREARELVENGAVTLDGRVITDPNETVSPGILQKGKKKQNQVKIEIE
jgi:tyrosyl-tRNA synthetase